jgi:hypothetical protein
MNFEFMYEVNSISSKTVSPSEKKITESRKQFPLSGFRRKRTQTHFLKATDT